MISLSWITIDDIKKLTQNQIQMKQQFFLGRA